MGSEPPNASAATRFIECPLNPPFVKSGNLLFFRLLSVFAGVDVLGAVIAILGVMAARSPLWPILRDEQMSAFVRLARGFGNMFGSRIVGDLNRSLQVFV